MLHIFVTQDLVQQLVRHLILGLKTLAANTHSSCDIEQAPSSSGLSSSSNTCELMRMNQVNPMAPPSYKILWLFQWSSMGMFSPPWRYLAMSRDIFLVTTKAGATCIQWVEAWEAGDYAQNNVDEKNYLALAVNNAKTEQTGSSSTQIPRAL